MKDFFKGWTILEYIIAFFGTILCIMAFPFWVIIGLASSSGGRRR